MKNNILLLTAILLLIACNNKSNSNDPVTKKDSTYQSHSSANYNFNKLIDSIQKLLPAKLSIEEGRADMDHLVPIGYNDRGSFAYFIDQDMGGASGLEFHINSAYDYFKLSAEFDVEMQGDSVYYFNRDLIGQTLRTADIKIKNSIERITVAELDRKYGLKLNTKKTFGAPNADYDETRKTLSSVKISYQVGDGYSVDLAADQYDPRDGIWDAYVSDIILVPTKELGMFGFAVIVTESIGFEGYTRKTIKLVSLGDVDG